MVQMRLRPTSPHCPGRYISPYLEMGAYEKLWSDPKTTWRRLADQFRDEPDALPSDLVSHDEATATADQVAGILRSAEVSRFGVRVHREAEYLEKLRDARNPLELVYFSGWWNLLETRCVAVVGTRNPSEEGSRRARKLTRLLVEDDFTVVSGLAAGIDTVAHTTAISEGGRTIAVLGTPLSEAYPRMNSALQRQIAENFLIVSQVPVLRYSQQDYRTNRSFFPERNITMSALTEATIIVEASETSGTRTQARAALQQGRKLFILESCFQRPDLTWPRQYERQGALRVQGYDQVREALGVPGN